LYTSGLAMLLEILTEWVAMVVGIKIARGSATGAGIGTVSGFNASAKLRAGEAEGMT
jgi:hypothetical protein